MSRKSSHVFVAFLVLLLVACGSGSKRRSSFRREDFDSTTMEDSFDSSIEFRIDHRSLYDGCIFLEQEVALLLLYCTMLAMKL